MSEDVYSVRAAQCRELAREYPKSAESFERLAREWEGEAAYRDESYPERACDYCGKPYRGPAVYCSLECATDDA